MASKVRDPINYFLLLRALFRSIGGGKFELLYKVREILGVRRLGRVRGLTRQRFVAFHLHPARDGDLRSSCRCCRCCWTT